MSSTDTHITRRLRRGLVLAAVAVTALACAGPAFADSIAYSGSDGNIWLATPDGERKHQVTADGTTAQRYRNPTQTDGGTILAIRDRVFHFLNQDGSANKPQWLAPVGASFYKSPLSAHIAPNGGLVAWAYIHSAHAYEPPTQRVAFSAPLATSPCVANCHSGYRDPRWLPGSPYAGMISTDGSTFAVQEQGASQPVPYFTFGAGQGDFESVDISRTGNKILISATPDGTPSQGQHEQGVLQLFQAEGPPRAAASLVCAVALGDETTKARWSPDGSKITWSDAQGVWVSPAPTGGGNGACNLAPKLIASGGQGPDFGPANVPTTGGPGGGDQGPGGDTGNNGNDTNNGNNNTNQNNTNDNGTNDPPATISGVSGARVKLAKALSRGYPVTFTSSEAGRASISVSASGGNARGLKVVMAKTVRVARGGRTLPGAGKHTVVAKFTSKARRTLRRARRVTLTVQVTVVDSAGNSATESKRVTIKR